MSSASFDFTPLLPAGLPPPAARWTGRVKFDFTGGNNDPDRLPLDGLIAAAECGAQTRGAHALDLWGEQRTAGLPAAARVPRRQAQGRCGHRLHGRRHPDHVGLAAGARPRQRRRCSRAAIPSSSRRTATRARSTGSTGIGVTIVGIPLDSDGMRMDALSNALDDLKRKGMRPKYIYTIPTVQNPTAHHPARGAAAGDAAARRRRTACRSSKTTAMPT